ncbi:DUF5615 family PIN-like protein [Nitrosomonas sp. sh817]|uniref:DUF5615 family PIN-like protein n=1 Tax=Nitrosomonas sp. sh817 TaxID=3070658 RepID=UPI0027DBDCE5|nr:DUF5615 family PIN-like protein [Nitrosomonas sp. sh817]WMJ09090.1 DUF5615 family PIN-like protein [Nitrosomonas sp. sh817]
MISKLLADENFPLPVIKGLIDADYDVLSIAEISPGINDRAVLSLARETGRSLLTFDVDFGDLVFFHGIEPPEAILYFRLHPIIVEELLAISLCALNEIQSGYFAVIQREGIRLRKLKEK